MHEEWRPRKGRMSASSKTEIICEIQRLRDTARLRQRTHLGRWAFGLFSPDPAALWSPGASRPPKRASCQGNVVDGRDSNEPEPKTGGTRRRRRLLIALDKYARSARTVSSRILGLHGPLRGRRRPVMTASKAHGTSTAWTRERSSRPASESPGQPVFDGSGDWPRASRRAVSHCRPLRGVDRLKGSPRREAVDRGP
jgi:hypothetical protein